MIPTTWWEDLLTWWESGTWEDRPFLGAMPNPSLGCFLLVGCCLSCLGSFFFFAFFGGDAKSLAWVFLARRVLPFVLGFFFFCFLFFAFFGGDAKSLAWVFLARRVLPAENWPLFQKKAGDGCPDSGVTSGVTHGWKHWFCQVPLYVFHMFSYCFSLLNGPRVFLY